MSHGFRQQPIQYFLFIFSNFSTSFLSQLFWTFFSSDAPLLHNHAFNPEMYISKIKDSKMNNPKLINPKIKNLKIPKIKKENPEIKNHKLKNVKNYEKIPRRIHNNYFFVENFK